jgi:hypothetical protein
MKLATKALYNSLRMSVCQDPSILTKAWQIEDYRKAALEDLFSRLEKFEIHIDKQGFLAYADEYDSPEEFVEDLVVENSYSSEEVDQVYLLVFELWRKLAPERQSISLVCDELDYQIFSFDNGDLERREFLDDAIANFYEALQKAQDRAELSSEELFSAVCEHCANDIPSFLYDYISELFDIQEFSYASELIQQFYPFILEKFRFDFLICRQTSFESMRQALQMARQLFEENNASFDLPLCFEILEMLAKGTEASFFTEMLIFTLHKIDSYDDLVELYELAREFFDSNGMKEDKQQIETFMSQQGQVPLDEAACRFRVFLSDHFTKNV